jgi:hypothetical protein
MPETPWKMPKVSVGQIVLWNWNAGAHGPTPAIVLGVGDSSVSLCIHPTNVKDHVFRSGVRHRDDPWLHKNPQHDGGVWCLTERDQKLDTLIDDYEYKRQARRPTGLPGES